jgi:presenilin enhancer 2
MYCNVTTNLTVSVLTVGFAFLPFLWIVNVLWFFKYAFGADENFQDINSIDTIKKEIRKYVIFSAIGGIVFIVLLSSWNIYFQSNRATLPWGDDLSFILPIGRA